jgi:hypothetical protein
MDKESGMAGVQGLSQRDQDSASVGASRNCKLVCAGCGQRVKEIEEVYEREGGICRGRSIAPRW